MPHSLEGEQICLDIGQAVESNPLVARGAGRGCSCTADLSLQSSICSRVPLVRSSFSSSRCRRSSQISASCPLRSSSIACIILARLDSPPSVGGCSVAVTGASGEGDRLSSAITLKLLLDHVVIQKAQWFLLKVLQRAIPLLPPNVKDPRS